MKLMKSFFKKFELLKDGRNCGKKKLFLQLFVSVILMKIKKEGESKDEKPVKWEKEDEK